MQLLNYSSATKCISSMKGPNPTSEEDLPPCLSLWIWNLFARIPYRLLYASALSTLVISFIGSRALVDVHLYCSLDILYGVLWQRMSLSSSTFWAPFKSVSQSWERGKIAKCWLLESVPPSLQETTPTSLSLFRCAISVFICTCFPLAKTCEVPEASFSLW